MPISSAIKGLQSIKSMQNVVKSGVPLKEESDFIKLYMLEKEKQRLMAEESKILCRLDYVQNRLRIIENIYEHSSHLLHHQNNRHYGEVNSEPGFTTIQIEY